MMRTLARCLLALVPLTAALASQAYNPIPVRGWWVGEITPQHDVLVLFDANDWYDPRSPPSPSSVSVQPITPAAFASASAKSRSPRAAPAGLAIGDPFEVVWDGSRSFRARVSSFAVVWGGYSQYLAARLQPDSQAQSALQQAGAGPVIVRAANGSLASASTNPDSALFTPELPSAEIDSISQLLTARMLQQLPQYLQKDQAAHDTDHAPLDSALLANPGKPRLDFQEIRLATGGNRIFVRAEWDVQDVPAFLCTAWLNAGPEPQILSISFRPADDQRDDGPGSFPFQQDLSLIPKLVRVVYLQNGATAVFHEIHYYESNGVVLYLYSDVSGLAETELAHEIFYSPEGGR